jgi:hypothetical protein
MTLLISQYNTIETFVRDKYLKGRKKMNKESVEKKSANKWNIVESGDGVICGIDIRSILDRY